MKVRFTNSEIRIRVSEDETKQLIAQKQLEMSTYVGHEKFVTTLSSASDDGVLLQSNHLQVNIEHQHLTAWNPAGPVLFEREYTFTNGQKLRILVEKDLKK